MEKKITKCSAIILNLGAILLVRKKGTNIFISPGGKIDSDETHEDCIKREILEELNMNVSKIIFFNTCEDIASFENKKIISHIYIADCYSDIFKIGNEIEEAKWFYFNELNGVKVGSVFWKNVIPQLYISGKLKNG